MVRTDITTGEQSVTAAGAVTGVLATAALAPFNTVKLICRGLTAGQRALFSVEDTANVTAFSDVRQVAVAHFVGSASPDGSAREWATYDIPMTRYGVANAELRINCLAIDAGATALVHGFIE